jgi:hypothetical protein
MLYPDVVSRAADAVSTASLRLGEAAIRVIFTMPHVGGYTKKLNSVGNCLDGNELLLGHKITIPKVRIGTEKNTGGAQDCELYSQSWEGCPRFLGSDGEDWSCS